MLIPWAGPHNLKEVTALYKGTCPLTGEELTLPRTRDLERYALQFASQLDLPEPKMVGLLLVSNSRGMKFVLKAFSGKIEGSFHRQGWVPPMLELEESELERTTRVRLAQIKTELQELGRRLDHLNDSPLHKLWTEKEAELRARLKANKLGRERRREAGESAALLDEESRADTREKREFKEARFEALKDQQSGQKKLKARVSKLKRERKELSRTLQKEMHDTFDHKVWSHEPWSLTSLFPSGPPTGTGDCCAPKLLHHANQHALQPIALAEFWHGKATAKRQPGHFYEACKERCQPLLGPLLCRVRKDLPILFEDQHLMAVEKFSGILTVPGHQHWNQDSLLTRLQRGGGRLFTVHRLDLETSGIVLFAKTEAVQSKLHEIFASRRVEKSYQALLSGRPESDEGVLEHPLGPDPMRAGCYRICEDGKPARTAYRVIDKENSRVDFFPHTGRSHQLRVHAAQGLDCPIQGDRLYAKEEPPQGRLLLHARRLVFTHPVTGELMDLVSEVPF